MALELLFWAPLSFLPYLVRRVTGQAVHPTEPFVAAFVPLVLIYLLARVPRWQTPVRAVLLIVLTLGAAVALGVALAGVGVPRPELLLAILDTNAGEGREFLQHFYTWRSYLVIALLTIPALAFIPQHRSQAYWRPRPAFGLVLVALFTAQVIALPDRLGFTGPNVSGGVIGRIENIYPFGVYPPARAWIQLGQALRLRARMAPAFEGDAASLRPGLRVMEPATVPRTYVVVLTESVARGHLGLYGYDRDTTPRLGTLAARHELTVFTDAISTQAQTALALFDAFTWTSRTQPNPRSVIDLFNAAGFETTWVSNQSDMGMLNSVASLLATNAARHDFLKTPNAVSPTDPALFDAPDRAVSERYRSNFDDRVLPAVDAALARPARDKFIVVHLMGSHALYKARYPQSDEFFTTSSRPDLTADQADRLDAYDNSIRFGDGVIGAIIDAVRATPGESFVLTLSDHGEEVYDFRDFAGHANALVSPWMLEIPLVVWLSPEYTANHPAFTQAIRASATRPYGHLNLPMTLTDLARFTYADPPTSGSIFSTDETPRPRLIGDRTYAEFMRAWVPDAAHAAGLPLLPHR